MSYLLDADVFIRAKNLHYGFEFCPAFWDWLVAANTEGKVFSTEKVYDELLEVEDELSTWAGARTERFFLPPNPSVLSALAEVSTWAFNQRYTPSAINTFLQVADYYVVAQALADGHTVVTHQRFPLYLKIKGFGAFAS